MWLVMLALLLTASPVAAITPPAVLLVQSSTEAPYAETEAALRAVLAKQGAAAPAIDKVMAGDNGTALPDSPPHDLIITIGTRAAAQVRSAGPHSPVLNLLITSEAFNSVWQDKTHAAAVVVDLTNQDLLSLSRSLHPRPDQVGILLGSSNSAAEESLRSVARQAGVTALIAKADNEKHVAKAITRLLDDADVIVMMPDKAVITPYTAKWLLYMAYQKKVPVIGYSRALADAGAVMAAYYEPADIGTHGGELAVQILSSGQLPTIRLQRPTRYTVRINHNVADSLGIHIDAPVTDKDQSQP